MGYIVSMNNAKGGVGKTTSTISIASGLTKLGRNVLCVDFDPQGGLSIASGIQATYLEQSMYHVIWESLDIREIISKSSIGYDIAPTNIDLVSAEFQLMEKQTRDERERALVKALLPVRDSYDYILIDNQPTLGLLAINSITASDYIIVPIATEYMSLRGFDNLLKLIQIMGRQRNSSVSILGVLATMFDRRNNHSKEMLAEIVQACRDRKVPMFNQVITYSVRFKEAPVEALSILDYWPNLDGATSYFSLAKYIDKKLYKGVAVR